MFSQVFEVRNYWTEKGIFGFENTKVVYLFLKQLTEELEMRTVKTDLSSCIVSVEINYNKPKEFLWHTIFHRKTLLDNSWDLDYRCLVTIFYEILDHTIVLHSLVAHTGRCFQHNMAEPTICCFLLQISPCYIFIYVHWHEFLTIYLFSTSGLICLLFQEIW